MKMSNSIFDSLSLIALKPKLVGSNYMLTDNVCADIFNTVATNTNRKITSVSFFLEDSFNEIV